MKTKFDLKAIFMTVFGTAMTGFAIGVFLTPNKIVGGGVSGISTLLFHTFSAPTGVTFFLINLLFLLISAWVLGKDFVVKTLLGVSLLSFFTQVFSLIPYYTDNLIIPTIFGGVLYGVGIGTSFAAGASTGGTDILGRLVQHKFKTVPIGKLLLFIDGLIILISLLVFKNLELTFFGIITLFISSFSVDMVIDWLNVSKIAFVITEKGNEIAHLLVSTSPRGVTLIDAVGAYTNTEKKFLFCALKESETAVFQQKILDIDEDAFIVFAESQRIKGKGFYLYK
ncbi:MAG: YitT family protein [Clostridia bacterium]|nr:YitT family protein [Clostridia bacterium]